MLAINFTCYEWFYYFINVSYMYIRYKLYPYICFKRTFYLLPYTKLTGTKVFSEFIGAVGIFSFHQRSISALALLITWLGSGSCLLWGMGPCTVGCLEAALASLIIKHAHCQQHSPSPTRVANKHVPRYCQMSLVRKIRPVCAQHWEGIHPTSFMSEKQKSEIL